MNDGQDLRRLTLILFAAARLFNYFFRLPALDYLSALLILLILLQALPKLDRITRLVAAGLFSVGAALLVWAGAPSAVWLEALLKNADMIALFICVPMISLPFFYEDYQSHLKVLIKARMQSILSFCFLVALCCHSLTVLISIGAISIMYELMCPYAGLYQDEDTFLRTLTRSHNSSGFWSPAWASMILLNNHLHVSWVSLIPAGLFFSTCFIGMDLFTVAAGMRRRPERYRRLTPEEGEEIQWPKIRTMLALALTMIGLIILLNLITPWDLMMIVPIVSLLFPLLAAVSQRRLEAYRQGMKGFYAKALMSSQTQCALFAAAGFLGQALNTSGLGELIPRLLPQWLSGYPALMVGGVMLLLVLPSLVGLHPAATGSALVLVVPPAALGLDVMTYSLAVLCGWLIAILVSPFTPSNLIVAGLSGRPSWSISLGLNGGFGAAALVVFSLLISLTGPLLG